MAVLFSVIMSASLKAQTPTEWPDLPLLTIETVDGVMPTATKVFPPEGCVGEGILSEYVPGRTAADAYPPNPHGFQLYG